MAIIDLEGITAENNSARDRVRQLGISEDMLNDYYSKLSPGSEDPAHDERVFNALITGLNLSEADRAFVKKSLDSGDGR
jgi:hypothetical protein